MINGKTFRNIFGRRLVHSDGTQSVKEDNRMKKNSWLAVMTGLVLLAAALPLGALAQSSLPDTELEGFVTELVEGGFMMNDQEIGEVLLNVDDQTVLDGVLANEPIEVGQYVIVQYDGRLTRSLPPQAHADKVGCYVLSGTVSEYLESGFLLTGDELFGDVIVHADGALPHVYPNVPVTIYYDGIMALSMPGQVVARCVIVPELSGVVSEKDEEGFTLTDEEGAAYRVLVTDTTLVGEILQETGEEANPEATDGSAGQEPAPNASESEEPEASATPGPKPDDEGASLDEEPEEDTHAVATAPAKPEGLEGEPGAADGSTEPNGAIEAEAAVRPAIVFADGDIVTVYFDGVMTASEPPQVNALEILVRR